MHAVRFLVGYSPDLRSNSGVAYNIYHHIITYLLTAFFSLDYYFVESEKRYIHL